MQLNVRRVRLYGRGRVPIGHIPGGGGGIVRLPGAARHVQGLSGGGEANRPRLAHGMGSTSEARPLEMELSPLGLG